MADVLDHGKVELIDFMGGDHRVTQAARVSLGNFFKETDRERDNKLIRYLMEHRHGTPFEHSVFTFYVKAPIFVVREWMRHRVGSYNEISARYTELPNEHYNPKPLRAPSATNRQAGDNPLEGEPDELDAIRASIRRSQDNAFSLYHQLLARGVARELARGVLPLATYTEFVWTVNARSLMNFVSLRMGKDAQLEIRLYAEKVMDFFEEKMPMTAESFEVNEYAAP